MQSSADTARAEQTAYCKVYKELQAKCRKCRKRREYRFVMMRCYRTPLLSSPAVPYSTESDRTKEHSFVFQRRS